MSSLFSGGPEARDNQSAAMGNHTTNPKESWGVPRLRKLGTNSGTTGPGDIYPVELSAYTGPS